MAVPPDLHPDLEALIGTVIHGRYRVDSVLGSGGMGAVFRAHHLGLDRDVALKVLHPRIGSDPAVSKRFDREATSASRLDHPNCVRVTDFGTTDNLHAGDPAGGTKYLVMEYLDGHELAAALGKPLAPARAEQIAIQVLEGLEHAHHCGVVHRDLKPANIFITTDFRKQEVVKLLDFGIAKLIDEQGAGGQEQLTREGFVIGTPRYMSPEQASGGKMDERSDLYAVGLILYEMLAGKPPFVHDDPGQLLRMQILANPPPLPARVPAGLAKVVMKLLEKSKRDRPASAREVLDALAESDDELPTLADQPRQSPRPSPLDPSKESRNPWLRAAMIGAVLLAVSLGIAVVVSELDLREDAAVVEGTEETEATTETSGQGTESESESGEPVDLPSDTREAERLRIQQEREADKKRKEQRRAEQLKGREK